ncbi:MAG: alkaline phosphatase family protein [Deltaproteobacteria bacterium]
MILILEILIVAGRFKSCIFIMADGARADVLEELLSRGDLPNISKYIVERGSYARAVTVFPSTTGPAYTPYLMGKFPGRCNLPGIRWFDRQVYEQKLFSLYRSRSYIGIEGVLLNSDLSADSPTIFELIPNSASILNEVSRGISARGDKTKFSKFYLKLKSHFTENCDEVDAAAGRILLKSLGESIQFTCVVFLGIDTYSHLYHPFHGKALDSYRRIDRALGDVASALRRSGKLDETLFVLGSDHGLTQTHSHFDALDFMDKSGYRTFYYPYIFRNYAAATASVMVSGNAMAHVYVKNPAGWRRRNTYEELYPLAASLLDRPEIDIIAAADETGGVRIKSLRGEASVWLDNGFVRYQKRGADPFGYADMPQKMTPEESLRLSFDTDYPDALVQLLQLFESPRTGDLVLSARRGFDLRARHENPEHCSSHGALFRDHMIVPLCMSAPIKRAPARTVDVFPTILALLGYSAPASMDGASLAD